MAGTPEHVPGPAAGWHQEAGLITLRCVQGASLRIHVLSDRILRFRFSPDGYFPDDFSYTIDPAFHPRTVSLSVSEMDAALQIRTAAAVCRIRLDSLHTTLEDLDGKIILEDDKGFHWREAEQGNPLVLMSKRARPGERYFGLGDKSCAANLRGKRLQNWNHDCFGYTETTDPLYRSIPFYYGLHEGTGYGVLFDNSFRTWFDFAMERDNAASFWAHGGEMDYYVLCGPSLLEVAEQYAQLTGRPELPPRWALGFHQCRWSYFPEARVREVAATFRSLRIPCDALYLDIDYMDGYRCFTWNRDHFPDPGRMIRDLAAEGFQTVVIIDPGIKIDPDYPVFREGLARQIYLRRTDGPFAQGKVWPGECYFPDFTRPEARAWWAEQFRDLIRVDGVAAVWNDMNEPAIFDVESRTLPDDVRFDCDGHPCSHARAHNVYGMQMARATLEGLQRFGYPKRPFVITRASFAGGQRYSAVWTGDNVASWAHLRLASLQCQRLSISGYSFTGSDIGGFNGLPDGELFVRWLETGIFHPLCRVHSIGYHDFGNSAIDEDAVAANAARSIRNQEPWSFGEPFTALARKIIGLRYRLLPALYTAMWQYVTRGTPVLRPLYFGCQADPGAWDREEEFLAGDHLLVCPVSAQGVIVQELYLPAGRWHRFRTGEALEGGRLHREPALPGRIPMFVRAGAALPWGPVRMHTGETGLEPAVLRVYAPSGSTVRSEWYEDAGEGYAFRSGGFLLRTFEVAGDAQQCSIRQSRAGSYPPEAPALKIELYGVDAARFTCEADGKPLRAWRNGPCIECWVPEGFGEFRIVAQP